MTTLIVKAIDSTAPGSHMERVRVIRAMRALSKVAGGTEDSAAGIEALEAYIELDDLLRPRLRTDNGTDVDEALEQLSIEDYDVLFGALLTDLLSGSVPTESAAELSDGVEAQT